jgi:uncharacterized repeat protein (TIGR01451 family)
MGNLASCAGISQNGGSDPFLSATPKATAEVAPSETEPKTTSGSAKAIEGIPLPISSEEGPVVANHMKVRQVEHFQPPASEDHLSPTPAIEGTQNPAPLPGEWCPPCQSGIGFEMGAMPVGPPVVPGWIGGAAIAPIPRLYPDEYLCDGGDRAYPVRYDSNLRLGLDTEDTVAEYTDHTGEPHVKPSNKVCVYAPRFGAMRSVSSPVSDTAIDMLASADKFIGGAGMRNRTVTGTNQQNLAPGHYRMRERASDIDVTKRLSGVEHTQYIASHTKLINTFQDLQFIQTGQLVQTDEVRLAKGIQAATLWTRTQFPVIAATTEQAQEVTNEFRPQELIEVDDRRPPGVLRIVKLADKGIAKPGDIITFTIRYDNLGGRELSQIRILDNLTPRLQFVDESETSDRPGELFVQNNEEGSVILEFHLDDPLPAGQGGVVTFQAKVR